MSRKPLPMSRRRFVASGAAGAALLGAPGWLRRAFAAGPDCTAGGAAGGRGKGAAAADAKALLFDAYRRAQGAGRPLLVLVVPADATLRWERAHHLGELLNHGDDATLAALGRCELVCAPMSAVRTLVPQAPEGEPIMVLVGTDRVPAEVRALAAPLPGDEASDLFPGRGESWEERERRGNGVVERRIATLGRLVRGAVGVPPGPLAALAGDARRRHAGKRVPGSKWAAAGGCGVSVEREAGEDEPNVVVGCGMGHVPEKSRRIVYFLALDLR